MGNISGDQPYNRDLIIKAGAISPLIDLSLHCQNAINKKQAAWALSNLCRGINTFDLGNPMPDLKSTLAAVPVFIQIIMDPSTELEQLSDCSWALAYIYQGLNTPYEFLV